MADSSPLKIAYQILRWSTLAALVISVVLILRRSPAPNVGYDPTATARAEQELNSADQSQAASTPTQVHLDSIELNSYLHDNLQLEGVSQPSSAQSQDPNTADPATKDRGKPSTVRAVAGANPQTVEQVQSSVKDVKIDMEGDLITAYVVFDFHGEDLSLELDGHVFTENGYLQFDPISGKLGSFPLPQSTLNSAVQKLMASPENREKLKLPQGISDVQVVDGHVVVTYE
ncbi:MAG TPA: hypothetical protein VMF66_09145 [Candidatus Acidoferrum sp.]|nr:hypothetical protein [Candidatus Acidoferrum sp.]